MRRATPMNGGTQRSLRLVALVAALLTASAPLSGAVLAQAMAKSAGSMAVRAVQAERPTRAEPTRPVKSAGGAESPTASDRSQEAAPPAELAAVEAPAPASPPPPARWYSDRDLELLARLVHAEAESEPFAGRVGVAAVVLNRVRHPRFPGTVAGVIFQPGAFEPVANGRIWEEPDGLSWQAARAALDGWDPTGGALYFYNPAKVSGSSWIWQVRVTGQIGQHLFGWR